LNKEILLEAFGVTWQGSKKKRKKKKYTKQLKEPYQEQQNEIDEMLKQGYSVKGLDAKIYKVKEIINGPKISS